MTPIRVVIVDDHGIVREGIRQVLGAEPDIAVVGEAADGEGALELDERERPDVMLLDITMPGKSGLEVARALRDRGSTTRVLMLSVHDDSAYVAQSVRSGAQGYVRKDTTPAELRAAVRALHAGDGYFSPVIARQVAAVLRDERDQLERATPSLDSLTGREREVLGLIARGLLNKEIAAALGISVRTVEAHRESVMRKLDARSVAALTRAAIAGGLCDDPAGP